MIIISEIKKAGQLYPPERVYKGMAGRRDIHLHQLSA